MKANELMIGDWERVCLPWRCPVDGHIEDRWYTLQVTGIRTNGTDANKFYLGFRPWGVLPKDVKPIPLTPEILEKNGFNDDGEGVYGNDDAYFIPTYRGFDAGTWETHIEPTEGIGDFSGKLRYVHELQHALRLCGIDKEIEL